MAESVREQILAAVASKLAAMTGVRHWGGRYPDDPIVERRYKAAGQITQFPWLCAISGPDSSFALSGTGPAGSARFDGSFVAAVYGYIRGTEDVSPETWLQRLWWDVVSTFLADQTLGGVAAELELVNPSPAETDEGEWGEIAGFVQYIAFKTYESVAVG